MFEATIYFRMTLMDRTSKRFLIFLHAVVIFYLISVLEGIAAKEIVLNDTTPYLMELDGNFYGQPAMFWMNTNRDANESLQYVSAKNFSSTFSKFYDRYDMGRSLYIRPSDGNMRGERWWTPELQSLTYNSGYVGDYLLPKGLSSEYEDLRMWVGDGNGNPNKTSMYGDRNLYTHKYDQRGPYGYQTVAYTVPEKYLSNSIGSGYSRKMEITYPTDIDTPEGRECEKRSSCKNYDFGNPQTYNNHANMNGNTRFPVVVFAYGGDESNPGQYGCFNHRTILNHLASHGFVVCCPPLDLTGETLARCVNFLRDEASKSTSPLHNRISESAGVFGWSAGGARAINAAAHPEGRSVFSALVSLVPCNRACSKPIIPFTRVGKVCIYDPDSNGSSPNAKYYLTDRELKLNTYDPSTLISRFETGLSGLRRAQAGACPTNDLQVKMPAFYGAGKWDIETALASGVRRKFLRGNFPGIFVEREEGPAAHHPRGGTMLWAGEVTAFLKLHLAGDLSCAPYIWGPRSMRGSLASYSTYNDVIQRPLSTKWPEIAQQVYQSLQDKNSKII